MTDKNALEPVAELKPLMAVLVKVSAVGSTHMTPAKDYVYLSDAAAIIAQYSIREGELLRESADLRAQLAAMTAERDKLILAVADHVTVRSEQYQRIAELEAALVGAIEPVAWRVTTESGDPVTGWISGDGTNEVPNDKGNRIQVAYALSSDAAMLLPTPDPRDEVIRMVERCAFPVSKDINTRGYNWCEAWLDEALAAVKELKL